MALPDVRAVEAEILGGLRNEKERLDSALFNLEFYRGDFRRFPPRDTNQNSDGNRYPRTSLFMKRVVDKLAGLLYKDGPKRSIAGHAAAEAWLAECYRRNNADALLQHADRLTFVSDCALVQAEPSPDPECPVKLRLWDASSFVVWCDPDDPCTLAFAAVIDRDNNRRRLRLWTPTEVREYRTREWDEQTKTAGATAWVFYGSTPNALGLVPFAPVHYEVPTCGFWVDGPGDHLRETNDWVNKRLTDMVDACRFNLIPLLLLQGVREGWRPPSPVKPGDVINPPADVNAGGDRVAPPDAKYVQGDSSFVAAGWDDLQNGIDHALEMVGVPPGSVRIAMDPAKSGAAIISEQIEPVSAAESRQRKAEREEDALKTLVLTVGARHLGGQNPASLPAGQYAEAQATAAQHEAAAAAALTLHWPDLYPRVPGTEADQGDQWLLDNGLTSRTRLAMERYHLTEEEAEEYVARIAEDLRRERELFADASPEAEQSETAAAKARKDLEAAGDDGAEDGENP
jgi:hypothetical protein